MLQQNSIKKMLLDYSCHKHKQLQNYWNIVVIFWWHVLTSNHSKNYQNPRRRAGKLHCTLFWKCRLHYCNLQEMSNSTMGLYCSHSYTSRPVSLPRNSKQNSLFDLRGYIVLFSTHVMSNVFLKECEEESR